MMLQKPIALQDMESVVSAPAAAALDKHHRSSSAWTSSLTFVCCFIRTANISTPSSGFWRTTRQIWTWGSPLMKISLDRSVCMDCFQPGPNDHVTWCDYLVLSANASHLPFQTHQHELKPGGSEIIVTNDNKKEYIQWVLKLVRH